MAFFYNLVVTKQIHISPTFLKSMIHISAEAAPGGVLWKKVFLQLQASVL